MNGREARSASSRAFNSVAESECGASGSPSKRGGFSIIVLLCPRILAFGGSRRSQGYRERRAPLGRGGLALESGGFLDHRSALPALSGFWGESAISRLPRDPRAHRVGVSRNYP